MPISIAEAAERLQVSKRRLQKLAQQGRIPGARQIAGVWILPDEFSIAPPPRRNRKLDKLG